MTPDEEWRPVPNHPRYEVSSLGRVRTVLRKGYRYRAFGKNGGGYPQVTLGRDYNKLVHSLVAAAFIGPRPEGLQICHNNGDKTDNRAENLRYDTISANNRDSIAHGTNVQANKIECIHGHPFDEANTAVTSDGWRRCRTCRRGWARDRKRALTAAKRAA